MPWTAARAARNSSIAAGYSCASDSASARARSVSTFVRSSVETPTARNAGSTDSRSANQAIVDSVGRVFPRSIWLMYSFENRPPASSVWVIPAATRSERTRSPRRTLVPDVCEVPSWTSETVVSAAAVMSSIPIGVKVESGFPGSPGRGNRLGVRRA